MFFNLIYIYITLLRSFRFSFVVGVAIIPISLVLWNERNKVEIIRNIRFTV